jgi:class 3 adenylate cyclase
MSAPLDPAQVAGTLTRPALLHELRTPLNALIGYSEMLLEDVAGEWPVGAGLEELRVIGRQLLDTVNDRLARHGPGTDRVETILLLGMMRTELRGPAAVALRQANGLLEAARTGGGAEAARLADLERIATSAEVFLRLLDDLLADGPALDPAAPRLGAPEAGPGEPRAPAVGRLLVVDDNETNLDLLSRRLRRLGHQVEIAASGPQALAALARRPFDLVLLDVLMPGMDGHQVLVQLKADQHLRHLPVIMMSALGELHSVVHCIELGAEDYLTKPFEPVLLRARVDACLGKKWMHDREVDYLRRIEEAQARADRLLRNVLPDAIADKLEQGQRTSVERFPEVTVLFLDISGFSALAARLPPARVVDILNLVFSAFDRLADQHGVEKIKTIGDAYMAASGLPEPRADQARAVAQMALEMRQAVTVVGARCGEALRCRIGIHTGPVIAGIIGTKRFSYDLWGDTVNVASRMESHGVPGQIQISRAVRDRLGDAFLTEPRGTIEVKGLGPMEAFFLMGPRRVARPQAPSGGGA